MLCIRTVSFSILINGQHTDFFQPKRGIRQGDPLSPYRFILCAEVLSGLINKSQQDGFIHGISIATNAPAISHVLYDDDSILFCRAKQEEATAIMQIPKTYQTASGQQVNMEKSEMIFSSNISMDYMKSFQDILPVKISDNINKYLGMPTHFGRSKEQDFNFIMDRIWKKLKGWKEKCLSFEGRGILIRVVAQAIPTYIMSCFLLPIVTGLKELFSPFGGEALTLKGKSFGLRKTICLNPNMMEEWDSKISETSTWQCWPNRFGGFTLKLNPLLPDVIKPNNFLLQMFFKPPRVTTLVMLGEVYSSPFGSLIGVVVRELGMDSTLKSGRTIGSLTILITKCYLLN